ncbi:MAG: transposase [Planctomycetaceae bacterium]|nr:transposase [Planctomycetaceae bacterium]
MTTPDLATSAANATSRCSGANPTTTSATTSVTKTKPIAVNFNGGKLTSDAGTILLQAIDQ